MNEEFQQLEDLERYSKGEMDGKELEQFETKLQEDASLLKELNDYQDMMRGIEKQGDDILWNELTAVREKMKREQSQQKQSEPINKPSAKIRPLFRRLAVAASIAFVAIPIYYWTLPNTIDRGPIYTNFYKVDNDNLPFILDDLEAYSMAAPESQQKKALATSLKNYENKNYPASFTSLTNYLETYPDDKVAQMYLGLSLIELDKSKEAIKYLEPLSTATFKYQDMAKWYLAHCYVKQENGEDKASALIRELANDSSSNYNKQAKELLNALK